MAVRASNHLIALLNIISFTLSIAILAFAIWFSSHHHHDAAGAQCEKTLEIPSIVLAAFLAAVSLAGIIGSCCRSYIVLWVYLFAMFVLVVALLVFTVFIFVVAHDGRGHRPNWLRRRVENSKNWSKIKSCIVYANVCHGNWTGHNFISDNLSKIQSSCCRPPTECSLNFGNATNWSKVLGKTRKNNDCTIWKNDRSILCYDCQSCKEGFLATIRNDWKIVAIINLCLLVFLIIVCFLGCCAFRNNIRDSGLK